MDVREMLTERAEIVKRLEALDVKAREEKRAMTTEETKEWDEANASFDLLDAQVKRAQQVEARKAAADQAPGTIVGARAWSPERGAPAQLRIGLGDTEARAMCHYLRTGDRGGLVEARSYNNTDMNVTTAEDGEVTVPVGMVQAIVAKRDETILYPRLGVLRVPGKGTTVTYPIDNEADVLFTSTGESSSINQDAPALSEKEFTLVKYAKYITLTWELLRDEDVNLMAFVNNWVGRGWAATHNNLLVTEALASGTAGLTLDAASAIGATEIPELVGKVMPEYQDGAQWVMHPTTLAYLQALTGDPFYFVPTPQGGRRELAGYPLNVSSYATALGASAKSLIFGNFAFMGMREGTGLTMLRDPYTVASAGQVRLWFWFDAVYGVLQAEAIQYATHPSA